MYCTHCGKENNDNAKFCKHCGKNISTTKASWYVRYHIFPDPKKPRTFLMGILHGYVFYLFIIWFLIALITGVAVLFSNQSIGSILGAIVCFVAAYFIFKLMRRELARDRQRRQQK